MDARTVASSSLTFPFVGILIISNGMFALLLWLWCIARRNRFSLSPEREHCAHLRTRRSNFRIRRQRQSRLGENTIEARIVAEIIPHGIQFQIAVVDGTERHLHQIAQFIETTVA